MVNGVLCDGHQLVAVDVQLLHGLQTAGADELTQTGGDHVTGFLVGDAFRHFHTQSGADLADFLALVGRGVADGFRCGPGAALSVVHFKAQTHFVCEAVAHMDAHLCEGDTGQVGGQQQIAAGIQIFGIADGLQQVLADQTDGVDGQDHVLGVGIHGSVCLNGVAQCVHTGVCRDTCGAAHGQGGIQHCQLSAAKDDLLAVAGHFVNDAHGGHFAAGTCAGGNHVAGNLDGEARVAVFFHKHIDGLTVVQHHAGGLGSIQRGAAAQTQDQVGVPLGHLCCDFIDGVIRCIGNDVIVNIAVYTDCLQRLCDAVCCTDGFHALVTADKCFLAAFVCRTLGHCCDGIIEAV